MAIKIFRKNKKAITALKLIPLVLIIYTCEERTFNNPFDTGVELNPDDWAPTNLTIEILSDSDVRLTWQNSKTNITVYKIERKISKGGSFVEVDSSDTTIYTDTGLITGNEYIYQVCAYAGDQKSSYISSDTIKTVFSAPYNFNAESLSGGIVLTWEDSTAFEESFQVERKAISSNAYTILDSTQANTYLDSVIALGNQYIYRVSAFSNYNSTSYTETVVVKYWQDCLDVWGGDAEEDNCGTCDNDSSNDCNMDCAGVVDGPAVEDCSGECGGSAVEDECGICNGSGSPENYDCDGNCTANVDCNGECGGSSVEDECGVCGGDGSTCSATVTDIDGNVYTTVTIGTQEWLVQNLKVTHYNNGDEIPNKINNDDWFNVDTFLYTSEGAYSVYPAEEDDVSQETCEDDCSDVYGNLYKWYAVDDSRGLCMEGWHVPTDDEWTILIDYLGGSSEAYVKMKETGTSHWIKYSGQLDGTNESGFTALPAGYRDRNGINKDMGNGAYFWSSLESGTTQAWERELRFSVSRDYAWRGQGNSVRCLADGGEAIDCAGVPGGSATEDNCGTCDSNSSNDCVQDCNDEWGGSAIEDECGLCGGANNSGCLFVKTFGDSGDDIGYSVQQTTDGGFIVVGSTLIKIDSNGNKEWEQLSAGKSVQETIDGGYIITGTYSASSGLNISQTSTGFSLIKTNSYGNSDWNKDFYTGNRYCYGESAQQTIDGGYIFAGHYRHTGVGGYSTFYVQKTNAIGEEEWSKTGANAIYSIQQTIDGGYISIGYKSYGSMGTQIYEEQLLLLKTDSQGDEEWEEVFSEYSTGRSVQQTADGGYIMTGEGGYLLKTDSQGNEEWDKSFGGSYDDGYSVKQTVDSGFIIAGSTGEYYNLSFDPDAWLIKTNSQGTKEWEKTFGGSSYDVSYSVQQTADGGYIIAGYTQSYGNGGKDIWLIKTDPLGNTVSASEWE